jgi:N-acetyl-gamma-glutamyl-phosphate reductase
MGSSGSEARRIPALAHLFDGEVVPFDEDALVREADVAFLAVPEGLAAQVAPALADRGLRVFDLSGAFRLRDPQERQRWYPHSPDVAVPMTYGLTEHYRSALTEARLVACAGCYPTAAVLALGPLVAAGLLQPGIVIDAKSGISGAGKTPTERTHFSEAFGSVSAYGVFAHRHAAEIEQELGVRVTFVPHLVPLDRGILETIYAPLQPGVDSETIGRTLEAAYGSSFFVRLKGEALPEIKHVAHTNFCDIGWRVDEPGGRLVLVSCIDNLIKGAAGQAVQNFNVAHGLAETASLN